MTLLAYWVHHLDPFLIRFTEQVGIRYYGLAYVAGFVTAGWLLVRYHRAGRTPLTPTASFDLMTALVVGVVAGGRIGYFILYQPEWFLAEPLVLFRVWEGGMASHGAFLGVVLALGWSARAQKIGFLHLGDLITASAPAGLMFGRIANFINGELWGKVAYVPWAMRFPLSDRAGTPENHILPRHPSQLYEAALEGALLLAYMQWRFWRTDVVRTTPGRLSGEFLIAYAIARVICEAFREPDASLFFGLSRGTVYSLFLMLAGAGLIWKTTRATASAR